MSLDQPIIDHRPHLVRSLTLEKVVPKVKGQSLRESQLQILSS